MNTEKAKDALLAQREEFSKSEITSRERVREAIAHQKTDRIPYDFWAAPKIWEELKQFLSLEDDESILDLLCIDMRLVMPEYVGPAPIDIGNGVFINPFGSYRVTKTTPYGEYYELVSFPLEKAMSKKEVYEYPYLPKKIHWDTRTIKEKISLLDSVSQSYIRYEACGIFEYAWPLFGLENFLLRMAVGDMELPNLLMEYITSMFVDLTLDVLESADGRIDMVYIYDDIGTQTTQMMSVPMWKKYILPWHQKYLKAIRQNFEVDIMYHSDGAIYPFIPALVENMGVDVLNPLQPLASGMDFKRIKSEFGNRLAFHGGIDVQDLLPNGSSEQIVNEVMKIGKILGQDGGYICSPAHKMQADVPIENIIALFTSPRDII